MRGGIGWLGDPRLHILMIVTLFALLSAESPSANEAWDEAVDRVEFAVWMYQTRIETPRNGFD
ncbi:hypothetical protein BH23PLA1_BH23PLA1_10580 [soil metagenome]